MTLRIGNRRPIVTGQASLEKAANKKQSSLIGFTFLEVMVASAVLALGTVLIYEAFFISLDSFNYYADYLNVSSWADDKLWQAQSQLMQGIPVGQESAEFKDNNKVFSWDLASNLIDEQANLYSLDLSLRWKTGKRESLLIRNTYDFLQQK